MRPVSEARIKKLTHILANFGEGSVDTDSISLNSEDVLDLYELANRFWLGASLANALMARDDFDRFAPEIIAYSKDLSSAAQKRNQLHKEQTIELVRWLNERGIEPLLIKGAAELFDGIDKPQGQRWMMDIDIVIPEDRVKSVWEELVKDFGYGLLYNMEFDWSSARWHHAPGLISPSGVSIELHRSITANGNPFLKKIAKVDKERINELADLGLEANQLSPSNKLILAISHDFISHAHLQKNIWDLRYSYTDHLLVTRYKDSLDWNYIQKEFHNNVEALNLAKYILSHYFAQTIESSNTRENRLFVEGAIARLNKSANGLQKGLFLKRVLDYFSPKSVLRGYEKITFFQAIKLYIPVILSVPKKIIFALPFHGSRGLAIKRFTRHHQPMLDDDSDA